MEDTGSDEEAFHDVADTGLDEEEFHSFGVLKYLIMSLQSDKQVACVISKLQLQT